MTKVLFVLLTAFISLNSCKSQKQEPSSNGESNKVCVSSHYDQVRDLQDRAESLIKSFLNYDSGIQILKISVDAGYDYKEELEVYSQETDGFLLLKEADSKDHIKISERLLTELMKIREGTVTYVCENNSSRQIRSEFFVRVDGSIKHSLFISGVEFSAIRDVKDIRDEYLFYKNFVPQ